MQRKRIALRKRNWGNHWKKSRIRKWAWARGCWGSVHLNWMGAQYNTQNLIWRLVGAIRAAIIDCRPKTENMFKGSICLIANWRTFCIDWYLWTKHASSTAHQRAIETMLMVKVRRRRWKSFCRPGRWWWFPMFSGIPMESSWLTTWKKKARQ